MKRPVRNGDRVVGFVEGDTFFQRLRPEHLLHSPLSVAKSEGALRTAQRLGTTRYQGTLTSTGEVFITPLGAFWGPYSFEVSRSGYEVQRALPLTAFHTMSVSESSRRFPGWGGFFDESGTE